MTYRCNPINEAVYVAKPLFKESQPGLKMAQFGAQFGTI